MTREEATKILDPETTLDAYAKISYYGGFEGESAWQDAVNEACRMGAAALRELDAQEKQESFGEWISVKDRLPEPGTEVFIRALCNGHEVLTTAMFEDGTIPIDDSEWNWYDLDFDYDEERDIVVDDEVTHWMPLPNPPKEEHHAE